MPLTELIEDLNTLSRELVRDIEELTEEPSILTRELDIEEFDSRVESLTGRIELVEVRRLTVDSDSRHSELA